MIFVLGFLFALVLAWYENKYIVLDVAMRPLALSTTTHQAALYLVRLVVTFGSLVGIFFVYGSPLSVAALATYWIFSRATFRTYFNREVQTVAELLVKRKQGDDPADIPTAAEALEDATQIVIANMKGAGRSNGF